MSFSRAAIRDRITGAWRTVRRHLTLKAPLLALCFCCVASASAQGGSEPILTARPGLCILQADDSSVCEMAVELIWNAAVSGSFCLYSSLSTVALQCWQSVREGRHHYELASPQGVDFWLQRSGADLQLARITVRIVSVSQRNPQRRRRRHVWSVL